MKPEQAIELSAITEIERDLRDIKTMLISRGDRAKEKRKELWASVASAVNSQLVRQQPMPKLAEPEMPLEGAKSA